MTAPNAPLALSRSQVRPTRPAKPLRDVDRYDGIRQYTRTQALTVWAATMIPMAVLAWIGAPLLSHHLGGAEPLGKALFVCLAAGLLWMLSLVLLLVRREIGSLQWPHVRRVLWLQAPRDPKNGRVGGKIWLWLIPFVFLSAALESLPIDPTGPMPRDLPNFITTDRAENFFHGNWTWFAVAALVALLAPLVEEIVFRCFLLPRTRDAFGRGDWVINGVLFTVYHLHQPWSMPATLLDSVFAQAYPTWRFRSAWIAIVGHTIPSFVMIAVVLTLVLK